MPNAASSGRETHRHWVVVQVREKLLIIAKEAFQFANTAHMTSSIRVEQEAKMAMAVKLFEMRRLSSGMAASLVGMDRASYLLRLSDFGVPIIGLDADELAEDIANA